ncbi:response regulator transcription factor [Cumulibacter soli]|uniref:response regulator transcription factor n=1 Tax=Cumulibacter soli TaxID=2546344 RepID=UPI001067B20D|nr:response regulator transcription factor [Cumulibacter soli]
MSYARPTAILVDDSSLTRASLPGLMPELDFVGSFSTADECVGRGTRADVTIIELERADKCVNEVRHGLDGLRRAISAGHHACVYTQEARPFIHAACLAAGAKGVVSRAKPLDVAEKAFLEVAHGHAFISQGLVIAFDQLPRRHQFAMLTPQQSTILNARARGLPFPAIAGMLHLPASQVQFEWRRICSAISHFLQRGDLSVATGVLGLPADDLADLWPCRNSVSSDSARIGQPA